jgi:hypothetical protein
MNVNTGEIVRMDDIEPAKKAQFVPVPAKDFYAVKVMSKTKRKLWAAEQRKRKGKRQAQRKARKASRR